MLAIKKQPRGFTLFLLGIVPAFLLVSCTEPGPRALLEGEQHIKKGQYPVAIEKLNSAVELLPQNAQAWNHLGLAYHHAGQSAKAISAYQNALRLDRNLAVARYNLGCLQLEQNNLPAAIAELTTYTSLQPKKINGWLKLGSAQLRLAEQSSGQEKGRQFDAAKKTFDHSLKITPTPEAFNALGIIQVQRNRARESVASFNSALQQKPNFSPALFNLSVVHHYYLNDYRGALPKYRAYLATKPRPANSGEVELLVRQIETELTIATRSTNVASQTVPIISTSPTNNPLSSPRATVAGDVKTTTNLQTKPVVAPVKSAPTNVAPPPVQIVKIPEELPVQPAQDIQPIKPTPNAKPPVTNEISTHDTAVVQAPPKEKTGILPRLNPTTWFKKKNNPGSTGPTQVTVLTPPVSPVSSPKNSSSLTPLPAKPFLVRYKYLSPTKQPSGDRREASRFFSQGVKVQRENNLPQAIEAYQNAVKMDPAFFEGFYNLGLSAYQSGNNGLSLSAYEQALAIQPDSANARYNFALALQKGNYAQDAANELEKVVRADPGETRAHLSLANLYAQQLYQTQTARQHYLKVLELEPRHLQATAIRYWLAANP